MPPHASVTRTNGVVQASRSAVLFCGTPSSFGSLVPRIFGLVLIQRQRCRWAPLLLDWAQMEAEEGAADRARELLNRAVKVLRMPRSSRVEQLPTIDKNIGKTALLTTDGTSIALRTASNCPVCTLRPAICPAGGSWPCARVRSMGCSRAPVGQ